MAPCDVPPGHTLLAIGQDLFSVEDYVRSLYNLTLEQRINRTKEQFASTPQIPGTVMVYTDLQALRGLNEPTNYGSGVEYADGLLLGGSAGLQVGLWLNGTRGCRDIVHGRLDEQIAKLVDYLGSCWARHVFLRIGYEFDNPGFGYATDPAVYQQAFRHLVGTCRRERACRCKTTFVWHSWAAGLPDNTTLDDFYPGDDVVDWMGISLFTQFYPDSHLGNLQTVQNVIDYASIHKKPVMIAESTPFGGICRLDDPWNDWFQPVMDLIGENDIAMWSYINCDWESQPMWHNVGFGDTRLSINRTVFELWQQRVLDNPRFAQQTLCHLKRESTWRLVDLMSSDLEDDVFRTVWALNAVALVLLLCCIHYCCCRGPSRKGYAEIPVVAVSGPDDDPSIVTMDDASIVTLDSALQDKDGSLVPPRNS